MWPDSFWGKRTGNGVNGDRVEGWGWRPRGLCRELGEKAEAELPGKVAGRLGTQHRGDGQDLNSVELGEARLRERFGGLWDGSEKGYYL